MTLYHYPALGLYVYASTKQILTRALSRVVFLRGAPVEVPLTSGDILRIDRAGVPTWSRFDDSNISCDVCYTHWRALSPFEEKSYIEELKSVAAMYGFTPKAIDKLLHQGFMPEEIEEMMYETCGVM